jgi:dihydroorotase
MSIGYFIYNALIINEDKRFIGCLKTRGEFIEEVYEGDKKENEDLVGYTSIDAQGFYLIPGAIDDQVHFREPGLTWKGDLYTEPKAAVAGGVTSFMEMPNTVPGAVTLDLLEDKYNIASEKSLANYSFFMGTSNSNLKQLLSINPANVCGVKIFMGSSTGDMLVDNSETLKSIFKEVKMLIALHCEDDTMIKENLIEARAKFGDNIPFTQHAIIRSEEACYASSSKAIELATRYNTRLHILHISTARELELFRNDIPSSQKQITSEACVHHLWFTDADYSTKGAFIKWNPAIKSIRNRDAIRDAVISGKIDVLATDHAPHSLEEKKQSYLLCPSGGPLIQHALPALFELCNQGVFTPELIVRKYAHAVADLFQIKKRGYLRKGFYADIVLINPNKPTIVTEESLLYKCKWSPFTGETFHSSISHTFVNGNLVYHEGVFDESNKGMRLQFER